MPRRGAVSSAAETGCRTRRLCTETVDIELEGEGEGEEGAAPPPPPPPLPPREADEAGRERRRRQRRSSADLGAPEERRRRRSSVDSGVPEEHRRRRSSDAEGRGSADSGAPRERRRRRGSVDSGMPEERRRRSDARRALREAPSSDAASSADSVAERAARAPLPHFEMSRMTLALASDRLWAADYRGASATFKKRFEAALTKDVCRGMNAVLEHGMLWDGRRVGPDDVRVGGVVAAPDSTTFYASLALLSNILYHHLALAAVLDGAYLALDRANRVCRATFDAAADDSSDGYGARRAQAALLHPLPARCDVTLAPTAAREPTPFIRAAPIVTHTRQAATTPAPTHPAPAAAAPAERSPPTDTDRASVSSSAESLQTQQPAPAQKHPRPSPAAFAAPSPQRRLVIGRREVATAGLGLFDMRANPWEGERAHEPASEGVYRRAHSPASGPRLRDTTVTHVTPKPKGVDRALAMVEARLANAPTTVVPPASLGSPHPADRPPSQRIGSPRVGGMAPARSTWATDIQGTTPACAASSPSHRWAGGAAHAEAPVPAPPHGRVGRASVGRGAVGADDAFSSVHTAIQALHVAVTSLSAPDGSSTAAEEEAAVALGTARPYVVVGPQGALLREGRSVESKKVTTLAHGAVVDVVEVAGRRARVVTPAAGWVSIADAQGRSLLDPAAVDAPAAAVPVPDGPQYRWYVAKERPRDALER
eukprot:TRINITY_DN632_c1_g1_i2.p1 TRINITY_DN632_c1_g1~~TRINITY_DN632_c1_g1_i2.p1  ORF type:complete len:711 (+),score=148.15 TRINITY_DN632_c1_g1_i2:65-2197(+)